MYNKKRDKRNNIKVVVFSLKLQYDRRSPNFGLSVTMGTTRRWVWPILCQLCSCSFDSLWNIRWRVLLEGVTAGKESFWFELVEVDKFANWAVATEVFELEDDMWLSGVIDGLRTWLSQAKITKHKFNYWGQKCSGYYWSLLESFLLNDAIHITD